MNPLAVECPKCKAKINQMCITKSGKVEHAVHSVRYVVETKKENV